LRIDGARRRGKRAFWRVIGGKRGRTGTGCGENTRHGTKTASGKLSGTASGVAGTGSSFVGTGSLFRGTASGTAGTGPLFGGTASGVAGTNPLWRRRGQAPPQGDRAFGGDSPLSTRDSPLHHGVSPPSARGQPLRTGITPANEGTAPNTTAYGFRVEHLRYLTVIP
jgi:hypothetical protein